MQRHEQPQHSRSELNERMSLGKALPSSWMIRDPRSTLENSIQTLTSVGTISESYWKKPQNYHLNWQIQGWLIGIWNRRGTFRWKLIKVRSDLEEISNNRIKQSTRKSKHSCHNSFLSPSSHINYWTIAGTVVFSRVKFRVRNFTVFLLDFVKFSWGNTINHSKLNEHSGEIGNCDFVLFISLPDIILKFTLFLIVSINVCCWCKG